MIQSNCARFVAIFSQLLHFMLLLDFLYTETPSLYEILNASCYEGSLIAQDDTMERKIHNKAEKYIQ